MVEIVPVSLGMVSTYLLKGQRPVLVDTGMRSHRARLLRALLAAGVAPGDLSLVIHTHLHVDHAGSSLYLQQQGARLLVQAAEQAELEQGRSAPVSMKGPLGGAARANQNAFESAHADVVVSDRLDLAPYGLEGEVIHTPGHTPGSLSVVVTGPGDETLIVAGDLFVGGPLLGMLNTRRPHRHMIIQDLPQMWRSIARLLDYNPALVYLGHGGPVTGAALKEWYQREHQA